MENKINEILNDLYAIDDGFKAHKRELRSLITDLLRSQPDAKFDEVFARRLRADLMTPVGAEPLASPYVPFFARFQYGAVGAIAMLLLVAPIAYMITGKPATTITDPISIKDISSGLTLKQQISKKGINAFGPLALAPTGSATTSVAGKTDATDPALGVTVLSSLAEPVATSTDTSDGSFKFTYTSSSSPFKLTDASGTVYKRTKGIESGKQLADIVQNANLGLANLSAFSKLTFTDIDLAENRPYGYAVSVNFEEGAVAISKNPAMWPEAKSDADRKDDASYTSIADTFLRDHSIYMSSYGKPFVASTSEAIIMTYPLIVGGLPVHDVGGDRYGLQIAVDTRENKVISVDNLTSQTYESSQYELETNMDSLIAAINDKYVKASAGVTVKEIYLKNPEKVLTRYWVTKDGVSSELYVPAIIFTVDNQENNKLLPAHIVVPVVKSFLHE